MTGILKVNLLILFKPDDFMNIQSATFLLKLIHG